MDSNAVENMAAVIAVIVGFSLALSQALGGLLTYLVEAIKATGKIRDGYSGLVAIGLGILLGVGLGALVNAMADEPYDLLTMLLVGAFAGALMAAGSVKTFKAMGAVNTMPAYTEGLHVGQQNTQPTRLAYPISIGTPSPAFYDMADEYDEQYPEAGDMHLHDEETWAATVDELGRTDQLTEAQQAAHDEAVKAAAAESPQNNDSTGVAATQQA